MQPPQVLLNAEGSGIDEKLTQKGLLLFLPYNNTYEVIFLSLSHMSQGLIC